MKNEILKWAWIKGNKRFLGKRGTKIGYARDLIYMKNIKLSKEDIEWLDLDGKDRHQLDRVQDHEWAVLLERRGWKWRKII